MVELFKLGMAKPLNAIVVALCVGFISLQLAVIGIEKVQAVQVEKQRTNDYINGEVAEMKEALIRIDTTLNIMKDQQDVWARNYSQLNPAL